jgi:hypothetical protein
MLTFTLVEAKSGQGANCLIGECVYWQGGGPERGLVSRTLFELEIGKTAPPKSSPQFCALSFGFELLHF